MCPEMICKIFYFFRDLPIPRSTHVNRFYVLFCLYYDQYRKLFLTNKDRTHSTFPKSSFTLNLSQNFLPIKTVITLSPLCHLLVRVFHLVLSCFLSRPSTEFLCESGQTRSSRKCNPSLSSFKTFHLFSQILFWSYRHHNLS